MECAVCIASDMPRQYVSTTICSMHIKACGSGKGADLVLSVTLQAHERLLHAFASLWALDPGIVHARLSLTKPSISVSSFLAAL